jgi:hypothetical protein
MSRNSKSGAMYTRRELTRSKLDQRRRTPPQEWVVRLMNKCLNADTNDMGYVAPADDQIDELLAAGLNEYLPSRAAVRKWVKDCAYKGWANGNACITPRGQAGCVRGPRGRFCKAGEGLTVLAPRVLLIKDAEADLLTPDVRAEYVTWFERIMAKETARPLLQGEKGAKPQSIGKYCTLFDVRHGTQDKTHYPQMLYNKMSKGTLLADIRALVADYLKKCGVSDGCFEAAALQWSVVFAHSYEPSHATGQDTHGMDSHVDDVLYCAAVYSLTGDGGKPGLWYKASKESMDVIQVPMEPGDIALIRGGTHHGVANVPRDVRRITLNVRF